MHKEIKKDGEEIKSQENAKNVTLPNATNVTQLLINATNVKTNTFSKMDTVFTNVHQDIQPIQKKSVLNVKLNIVMTVTETKLRNVRDVKRTFSFPVMEKDVSNIAKKMSTSLKIKNALNVFTLVKNVTML